MDLAMVHVERRGDVQVARVSGEIDMSNVGDVRDRLRSEFAVGSGADPAVLDLSEVIYLDSAALALLDDLSRSFGATRRTWVVVAPAASIARRTIALAGLDVGLRVSEDLDAALSGTGVASS